MNDRPNYEIERTLVLSTTHITREDDALLEREDLVNTTYDPYEFGVRVFISNDPAYRLATRLGGFSVAFQDLIELAHAKGCSWLRLDSDGPVMDNLKTFDW